MKTISIFLAFILTLFLIYALHTQDDGHMLREEVLREEKTAVLAKTTAYYYCDVRNELCRRLNLAKYDGISPAYLRCRGYRRCRRLTRMGFPQKD